MEDSLLRAQHHQLRARQDFATVGSNFLLSSPGPGQSPFALVASITGKVGKPALVRKVRESITLRSEGLTGDREALHVFAAQLTTEPTISVFNTAIFAEQTLSPLPGGAPIVDHLKAWILTEPTWTELLPTVTALQSERLPSPDDTLNALELTLGISTPSEWLEATQFFRSNRSTMTDKLVPFCAADTESTPLHVTWDTSPGTSTAGSLMNKLSLAKSSGLKSLTFNIATRGQPSCGLPTRFFYGGPGWQIHVRLPTTHLTVRGAPTICLDLSTTFCNEAKSFFLGLESALGVGVTADLIEWSQTCRAIWGTSVIDEMQKPVELEHLARAARINTLNASIFHLNWWGFGTILPKSMASSLGDGRWGRPLQEISSSLRQYLTADVAQTARIGQLLTLVWSVQTFPDLSVVKDANESLTTTAFVKWIINKVFKPLFPGWVQIRKDEYDRHLSIIPSQQWVVQPSLSALVSRLNPPSLEEHNILWSYPDWPSITCGGPRSLHQVRAVFLNQIIALRKLDHDSWKLEHEDKKMFWRFGIPIEKAAQPRIQPTSDPGLLAGPGLGTDLPTNPANWTPLSFRHLIVPTIRTERPLILEFMRLRPDKALAVMTMTEERMGQFKTIVHSNKIINVVTDIRKMLRYLHISVERPPGWVDPYDIAGVIQRRTAKAMEHLKRRLPTYLATKERAEKKIKMMEQALSDPLSDPIANLSALLAATAPTGFSTKPTSKEPIRVRLGTARDQLSPTRKVIVRPQEADQHQQKIVKEINEAPQNNDEIVDIVLLEEPFPPQIPTPPPPVPLDPQLPSVFTLAMQAQVREVLLRDGTALISTPPRPQVKGDDILTVGLPSQLNDNIIDSYLQMIVSRAAESHSGRPRIHAFNTFFYPKLETEGFSTVRTWSCGVDIFHMDLVFFPIHTPGHWTLVVADTSKGTITYLDSVRNAMRASKVTTIISNYIVSEHKDKKGYYIKPYSVLHPANTPQQMNGLDCGVFLCQFAEHIARSKPLTFTHHSMNQFRDQMVWEIAYNTLLGGLLPKENN